jgi:hypothetical protein
MALRGSTQSLALAATPSEHEAAFWACSGPWPAVCSKLARRFSYLETIPEELVLTILELCDMKELLACQSVRVQFVMNKHTCTHVPNNSIPHTDLPCSQGCDHKFREPTVQISPTRTRDVRRSTERAEQGREARVADRVRFRVGEIDSAKPEEVELFAGLGYPLDVSGNTLVFYKPMGQNKVPGPHRELMVCRAPSAIRRIELAHWVLTVPFGITDICIDASQDLLIYFLYVSRISLSLPSLTFFGGLFYFI